MLLGYIYFYISISYIIFFSRYSLLSIYWFFFKVVSFLYFLLEPQFLSLNLFSNHKIHLQLQFHTSRCFYFPCYTNCIIFFVKLLTYSLTAFSSITTSKFSSTLSHLFIVSPSKSSFYFQIYI